MVPLTFEVQGVIYEFTDTQYVTFYVWEHYLIIQQLGM